MGQIQEVDNLRLKSMGYLSLGINRHIKIISSEKKEKFYIQPLLESLINIGVFQSILSIIN